MLVIRQTGSVQCSSCGLRKCRIADVAAVYSRRLGQHPERSACRYSATPLQCPAAAAQFNQQKGVHRSALHWNVAKAVQGTARTRDC